MGDWPILLTVLAVGYTLGRVRPLRELVRRLQISRFVRSAEQLAKRDRMWGFR